MCANPTSADLAVLMARLEANKASRPQKRDKSRAEESEAKLQRSAEQWLDQAGAWYHHDRSRQGDQPGVPDLLICWHGEFVAVELKSRTGKLRPEQMYSMAMIRKSGGRVFVARSLEEFIVKMENGYGETVLA